MKAGNPTNHNTFIDISNENKCSTVVYNEACVAVIRVNLVEVSHKFNNPIICDYDDLDYFEAMDFIFTTGFKFMLFKYKGMPDNHVAIFFQSQLVDWKERLNFILDYLAISEENVVEINEDYFQIP